MAEGGVVWVVGGGWRGILPNKVAREGWREILDLRSLARETINVIDLEHWWEILDLRSRARDGGKASI